THPLVLHSFPTRRSSDLFGAWFKKARWILTRRGANIASVRWSIPRITRTPRAGRFSGASSMARSRRSSRAFWSGKSFRDRKFKNCGAFWTGNKNDLQRRQSNPERDVRVDVANLAPRQRFDYARGTDSGGRQ